MLPGINSHISGHITCKFQYDTCGIKFIEDIELKKHISEDHRAKCEGYNTILENGFDLESHRDKLHGSRLKDACLWGYCDQEKVKSCRNCVQIFKGDDDCLTQNPKHKITCEICNRISINEVQVKYNTEEHHDSSLKRPVAADGDKREEEGDRSGHNLKIKIKMKDHI